MACIEYEQIMQTI